MLSSCQQERSCLVLTAESDAVNYNEQARRKPRKNLGSGGGAPFRLGSNAQARTCVLTEPDFERWNIRPKERIERAARWTWLGWFPRIALQSAPPPPLSWLVLPNSGQEAKSSEKFPLRAWHWSKGRDTGFPLQHREGCCSWCRAVLSFVARVIALWKFWKWSE